MCVTVDLTVVANADWVCTTTFDSVCVTVVLTVVTNTDRVCTATFDSVCVAVVLTVVTNADRVLIKSDFQIKENQWHTLATDTTKQYKQKKKLKTVI